MYAMSVSLPTDAYSSHAWSWIVTRMLSCLVALMLVACGGSDEPGDSTKMAGSEGASSADAGKPAPVELKSIDPAVVGAVHGVVGFAGTPPVQKPLSMRSAPYCVAAHKATDGILDDRIQIHDGRLQNAFVWVMSGLEGYKFKANSKPVELDQKGCMYEPRVVGAERGQEIIVMNSDDTLHNVHTHPDKNRPQNIAQPAGSSPRELDLKRAEVMVRVTCDIHPWMTAWIGVVDNPFFAVTGPDGTYRFDGLPPGEFTLGVWHERLGQQEVTVVLDAHGNVTVPEVVFKS